MAEKSVNIAASLSQKPLMALLIGLLFIVLIGFGANSYYAIRNVGWDEQRIDYANQINVASQEIAKNANAAMAGNLQDYAVLGRAVSQFRTSFEYLTEGNPVLNLPGSPDEVKSAELDRIGNAWKRVEQSAQEIQSYRNAYGELRKISSDLDITASVIQQEYNKVVATLLRSGTSPVQIAQVQKQAYLLEKMVHNVDRVLEIGSTKNLEEDFARARADFGKVQEGLINGDRSRMLSAVTETGAIESLTKIDEQLRSVPDWSVIKTRSDQVEAVKKAVAAIHSESEELLLACDSLVAKYRELADGRFVSATSGVLLGSLGFLLMMIIASLLYQEANSGLEETALRNEKNQTAILRLLDEIADLADGDLTVQATVTESFTGAIADSINFSIDQMREVVSRINETSSKVSAAAQETQRTARELAESSDRQATEILDVSGAVDDMAVSIDRVSYNAAESSGVAERSVQIANNGAEVVQNTIDGMEKIRGQIQETSKRIKRLGESSQEIGDIVSLINDIADQTNILSLNAAIQASMAGDAGRGFAVVADEVQRLAERSGGAAKQITGLVQTIQSDTNEAVISMEQTTAEVVRGTKLAGDAGVALGEIEGVSKSLAEIIENISDAARQQAASAGQISNTMKSIQEITSKTTEGTRSTATAVGKLAEMTNELRSSVSGFKIP